MEEGLQLKDQKNSVKTTLRLDIIKEVGTVGFTPWYQKHVENAEKYNKEKKPTFARGPLFSMIGAIEDKK